MEEKTTEKNDLEIAAGQYFLGRFIRPLSQTELSQPNQSLNEAINTPTVSNMNYNTVQTNPLSAAPNKDFNQNNNNLNSLISNRSQKSVLINSKPFQSNQIFSNSTHNGSTYSDFVGADGNPENQAEKNKMLPINFGAIFKKVEDKEIHKTEEDNDNINSQRGPSNEGKTPTNTVNNYQQGQNNVSSNPAAIALVELSGNGNMNVMQNLDSFAKQFVSPSMTEMSHMNQNQGPTNNQQLLNGFIGQSTPHVEPATSVNNSNSLNNLSLNTSQDPSNQQIPTQTLIQQELSSLRPKTIQNINDNTSKVVNIEDGLFQLASKVQNSNNFPNSFKNPLNTNQYNQMNPMYELMSNGSNNKSNMSMKMQNPAPNSHQSRSDMFFNNKINTPEQQSTPYNSPNNNMMSANPQQRVRSSSWQPINNNSKNRPVWFQGPSPGHPSYPNQNMNEMNQMYPGNQGENSQQQQNQGNSPHNIIGANGQAFYNAFQPLNINLANGNNPNSNRWEQLRGLKFTPILNHKKAPFKSF